MFGHFGPLELSLWNLRTWVSTLDPLLKESRGVARRGGLESSFAQASVRRLAEARGGKPQAGSGS